MRIRVAVALAALTSVLFTFGALAQQPRRAKPKPKPTTQQPSQPAATPDKTAADAGPAEPTAETNAPPSSAATNAIDAGVQQAAPKIPEVDGGGRSSPLNPGPGELPQASSPPPPSAAEYDKLIGDVAALRSRVAAITDALFHSRIALAMQIDGGHARIARLTVSVDDGIVYTAPNGFRGEDLTAIYEHGVAPGRHAVTVDIERKDDRDETYRTSQRTRFLVEVPKDERLDVRLFVSDDSTMGEFGGDHSGRYDLRVRAKAVAKPMGR